MNRSTGELADKVAIVSGAARGIGLETARRMAAAGAHVVIADLPSSDLEGALASVREHGEVSAHPVDLRDEATVEELVSFTTRTYGGLHVLNNNAVLQGLPDDTDVVNMTAEVWDRVFEVNARGTMLMCKHALRTMIVDGGGAIVNISSGTANAGQPYQTAYACSKGAIQTLTKYVATQYGDRGVRANCIAPGLIATEALRQLMPKPMQDMIVASKLVGRLGEPRDIAELVVFLASDRASFITGEVIGADGGFFAHVPSLAQERELTGGASDVIGR